MHRASQEAWSGERGMEKRNNLIWKPAQVKRREPVLRTCAEKNRQSKTKRMDTAHLLMKTKIISK